MTGETKFSVLVSLFNWIQKTKTSARKRSKFRKFLDTFCDSRDYFSAIRLILPWLDRERGSYGLKESVLATCLIDALDISRDAPDALRLINWRKGGSAKAGPFAGNFALVAAEVLQRRQGTASGGLTIKELNDFLDKLASSEARSEKTSVMSALIHKTNAQEMKWIIMIILKDLKLGMSERSIFHEFHPDAEDLFNVTCDLKLVCEKLKDRNQRHKRQDIEVGKAVRPQLAMRVSDAVTAWKKLHGREVVVECKFDGDRIQIHKNRTDIHYFSRNFLDHLEYAHAMSDLISQNISVDKCILDGEMLVWDTSLNQFAEFGSNQEIAKAARDGLETHRQLCYVAFDVLYVGDTSVIHQSLKERHELLRKVVKPLKGRLEVLLPDVGLNTHRAPGEPCWSAIAHNADDVERFFEETVENRDEGIVLKDVGSKWEPGDRSGKWLKLKPDYIRAGSDLDVLIIGGYYGSGRRGGEVAQFLVGLADRSSPDAYPRRFISFCRVGTGLSNEELDTVVTKLKPYFRKYEYPKRVPPSFYQVTNHSKERPDVWIESPEKSVILSITSDIRMITSEVFAAPYSLRFPRIDRVRYDKPWHECLDIKSFIELVHSSNGTTQKPQEHDEIPKKSKRKQSSKRGARKDVAVPSHFMHTDVSNIKGKSLIFSDMMFYFANVPRSLSLDELHKMIVENGGKFSMNLNNSVTHCVAAESSGLKFRAAQSRGDVIHFSWLLDCCSQNKLLRLQPKYFLHLSDSTRRKLQDEIDKFSDSYYWEVDLEDIKQLLSNIHISKETKSIQHYKKKFCPKDKWSCLQDCSIYIHLYTDNPKPGNEPLLGLALRRLTLEVSMSGGKVCTNLSHATHFVVLSLPEDKLDFECLTKSINVKERRLLSRKQLEVVAINWLEDSLQRQRKLPEDPYWLKPSRIEESEVEGHLSDRDTEEAASSGAVANESQDLSDGTVHSKRSNTALEDSKALALSNRNSRRRRGQPSAFKSVKKGKARGNQTRTIPGRRGRQPSKIAEVKSEESSSSDESEGGGNSESEQHKEVIDEQKLLGGSKKIADRVALDIRVGKPLDKACEGQNSKEKLIVDKTEVAEVSGQDRKSEAMGDPVQSMLLDMIPSLGAMKDDSRVSIHGVKRPSLVTESEAVEKQRIYGEDRIGAPVKKKKVSYKDVAEELLKD